MTAQELAAHFGCSEYYVKTKFDKLQKKALKDYGIKILKVKEKYRKYSYFLEEAITKLDLAVEERPVSLIAEPPGKKIFIEPSWFELDEFSFMLLIALFCMPHYQFKGNVRNFMRYAGIKNTIEKVALAKGCFIELSLQRLVALSYIKGEEILVKGVPPKIKKDGRYIIFTVADVIKCVQLSLKYNLRSWSNCLRVSLAAQLLEDYSIGNISELTRIKDKEIGQCLDALAAKQQSSSS